MPKTKKYIDKKNAVTFRLVHRSQKDPLVADEDAPQRVLQAIEQPAKSEKQKLREEEHKHGIYFDDDYDYLQHLRDSKKGGVEWEQVEYIPAKPKATEPKIVLPSSVLPSNEEEEIGMLNKAATQSGPRLDLDPDLVAAMDDDFDFSDPENLLEDNFMELANGGCSDIEEEGSDIDVSSDGDFMLSDDDEFDENKVVRFIKPAHTAKTDGQKSRFTEYSHTSYSESRPDTLKHLDARFEKFYEQYDDDQIGALEDQEIEGYIDTNSEIMQQCLEEFENSMKKEQLPNQDIDLKETILTRAQKIDQEPEEFDYITIKKKPEFDCQSILSTNSNLYNRPKVINPFSNNNSSKNYSRTLKAMVDNENSDDESTSRTSSSIDAKTLRSELSTLSIRPKDETPEQRRERKHALKEFRREKRMEKKQLKNIFSQEKSTRTKVYINNKNIQGKRLI